MPSLVTVQTDLYLNFNLEFMRQIYYSNGTLMVLFTDCLCIFFISAFIYVSFFPTFQKEQVSRHKTRPVQKTPEKFPKDDYEVEIEDDAEACKQLSEFEKGLGIVESDSD